MIEFILGLYLSWWFIITMFIIIPFTFYNEHEIIGLIFFTLLAISLFIVTKISLITLGIVIASYLPIGFIWSKFRWNRRGEDLVEKFNKVGKTAWNREILIKSLKPENNIEYIASTILGWPFSVLENVFSDLFIFVKTIIKEHLITVYAKATAKHMNNLKDLQD